MILGFYNYYNMILHTRYYLYFINNFIGKNKVYHKRLPITCDFILKVPNSVIYDSLIKYTNVKNTG